MRNTSTLLSILAIASAFWGCEKDNDPPSQSEMIIGKDWKITSYVVSENGSTPQDLFASPYIKVCFKDDIYKFSTGGKYLVDEGATKCDPGDPQTYQEGTWTIADEILNKTYPVTGGAFTEYYTIVELTPTQMVLDRTFKDDRQDTFSFKITYVSQ